MLGREADFHAQSLQNIRCTGFGRRRAVAVFRDRNAAGRDDQPRKGRDIPRTRGIAPRSHDVNRALWGLNGQHAAAHGFHRAGDFLHRLAAHAQGHEKARALRSGRPAGKKLAEREFRFVLRQRQSTGDLGDEGFERIHIESFQAARGDE